MTPPLSTALETPDTIVYKTPEWAVTAVAEGRDPADVGASSLHKRAIAWFVSMATTFALLGTPTSAWAQGPISAEAFKKCEAELIADYAGKIERARADGKPHLIPVYERRRSEAITNLCTLVADNATGRADIAAGRADIAAGRADIAAADQKIATGRADIAAADQKIATGRADIAAGRADIAAGRADIAAADQKIAANKELWNLFDEAKRLADKITAGSTDPKDFKELNTLYAKLQEKKSAPGVSEVLPLIASLIAKGERLKGV
jgi:hypothetical protein